MNRTFQKLALLLTGLILVISCSDEKIESKNMEQIYKEEGVPIKVEKIKKKSFERRLTYNTSLSGIRESSASSMIGGRIERVLIKVGDFVKKDQTIIEFPTDNPSTQYYQAKVSFENSKNMFERYKNLYEIGGVSAQDFENVKTQYEVNKANWESVQKMVKILAPISGFVTKVAVQESDNVKKEIVLATIADLRQLKASIQVAEDEVRDIKVGTKAYAEWQGMRIDGKVIQVDMAMDPQTQSFNADLVFDNPNQKIKAGVTADIEIFGGASENSISVERKNLIKKGDDYYAFVVENDVAKEKNVKLGKSSGLYTEIVEGLQENDLLVTEGQMFLENNAKVKIIN